MILSTFNWIFTSKTHYARLTKNKVLFPIQTLIQSTDVQKQHLLDHEIKLQSSEGLCRKPWTTYGLSTNIEMLMFTTSTASENNSQFTEVGDETMCVTFAEDVR